MQIHSVEQLRKICRRRESFLNDVRRSCAYQKVTPFGKQVSKLLEEPMSDDASEFSEAEKDLEIRAMALLGWNCHQEGHR